MWTVKSANRPLNQQCPLYKMHKERGRAKTRTQARANWS